MNLTSVNADLIECELMKMEKLVLKHFTVIQKRSCAYLRINELRQKNYWYGVEGRN